MRWAGHVASKGGKPEGKRHLKKLGVDEGMDIKKQGGRVRIGFAWLTIETTGGLL
jgi:hypothetical protein